MTTRTERKYKPSGISFVLMVYVELVLFNNLAIDFLLIVCVQMTRRRKLKIFRSIIAGVFGSVIAVLYALFPDWGQVLTRLLLSPAICLIFDVYGHKNKGKRIDASVDAVASGAKSIYTSATATKASSVAKRIAQWTNDFISSIALFTVYTYLLGGTVYGLSYVLRIDVNSYATLGLCALGIALVLLSVRAILHKTSTRGKHTCNATLVVENERIDVRALCDSGNLLTDVLSGLPIMILSASAEHKLPKICVDGYVEVETVGGQDSLPIVKFDEVLVCGKRYQAYGALARKDFDDFDVILQNSMF